MLSNLPSDLAQNDNPHDCACRRIIWVAEDFRLDNVLYRELGYITDPKMIVIKCLVGSLNICAMTVVG